ncbi:FecR family protein [Inquilinus limosus]|uniref:FecR family protein n=1 Tax=Inquilinus limosus TaxID=171674 RepID=UPI003F177A57
MSRFLRPVGFVLACLLLPAAALAQDRPKIGQVDRLEPAAGAYYQGEDRLLDPASPVFLDDTLWTGPQSRLQVSLDDGTELTLGPAARLLVDRFAYAGADGGAALALRRLQGAFLFVGGGVEQAPDHNVTIETGVATLGVRGTRFFAGPIDGAFGVLVLDGSVQVATDAGSVTLGPGEGTSVTSRREPPGEVRRWPAEKVQRALDMVGFR